MLSAPRVIIVTSCTNKKKNTGEVVTFNDVSRAHSLASLVHNWISTIALATQYEVAFNLYKGRSFTEAKLAAREINADLFILSAGHGLIHSDEHLPSYNLTVSASPDNELLRSLSRLQHSASDWWQMLTQQFAEKRSLTALMDRTSKCPVLLALPAPYLKLISQDLANLNEEQVARLRIFTSEYGASELPQRLHRAVMPYDERLEGLTNFNGTRVDFAQRALRHFTLILEGHLLPLEHAKQNVVHAMDALAIPVLPKRVKKKDSEIVELIEQNWERLGGSSTALLRYMRDDALVACAQGRFAKLHRGVQLNLKSKGLDRG